MTVPLRGSASLVSKARSLNDNVRDHKARSKLRRYVPYPKQKNFHAAGAKYRERLLMAANQVGKTTGGAAEAAMHLTGRYPDWWQGRRFTAPVRAWAGSDGFAATRDGVQRLLVGPPRVPSERGSGLIPGEDLHDCSILGGGVPDCLDGIVVKHWRRTASGRWENDGLSTLGFKSYDQGREKWQGETLDFVWFDEEPPYDVYVEGLTRTNATNGLVWLTFTPLKGMSEVVMMFKDCPGFAGGTAGEGAGPRFRHVQNMTLEDVSHYSEEERAGIIAAYAEHERDARTKGIPTFGSGLVFPLADEAIACEPFAIPDHFDRINGVDFGYDHPFAAVSLAWDKDSDVIYVVATYREAQQTPIQHAAAIKPWGEWIPCAWPHDGLQHDKGSGHALKSQYAWQGLSMLYEHATHEEGGNGVEAGVIELLDRMKTGRFKVFRHLNDWFAEKRMYHRENGLIVKRNDDLISATRYAVMMRRFAMTKPKRQGGGGRRWRTGFERNRDAWMG